MRSLLSALGVVLSSSLVACASTPSATEDEPKLADDSTKTAPDAGRASEGTKPSEAKTTTSGSATATPNEPVEATNVPANACAKAGEPVYAFEGDGNAWRYSNDPNGGLEGFASRGVAFRGAPDDGEHVVVPVYLVRNAENGDYMITTVPTEGKNFGYGPIAEVAHVFLEQFPGSVPLTRYLQETPALRHRVSIDEAPEGWQAEPPRGFVCPR